MHRVYTKKLAFMRVGGDLQGRLSSSPIRAGVGQHLIRASRPTEIQEVAEYCAVLRSGDDEGLYDALPDLTDEKGKS